MTGPRFRSGPSVKHRVLVWLRSNPGPHDIQAITEGTRAPVRNVHAAVASLLRDQITKRVAKGTYEVRP